MKTIIRLTFLEMFKKKILYLSLILTTLFLLLYGTALYFGYESLDNMDGMIRAAICSNFLSMGIYVASFITSFLSIFASVGAISSEIEQGTYDAVATKPIHRFEILLGRLFGIVLVLLLYSTFFYGAILGLNAIMGKGWMIHLTISSVVKALLIFYLLPILLASLGILFSSTMSTMGSGVTLAILYFCAMVGGILEQIGTFMPDQSKHILINIGILTSLIMPSELIYRKASSLLFTTSSGITLSLENIFGGTTLPSTLMMVYIIIYIISIVLLSIYQFRKRDI